MLKLKKKIERHHTLINVKNENKILKRYWLFQTMSVKGE